MTEIERVTVILAKQLHQINILQGGLGTILNVDGDRSNKEHNEVVAKQSWEKYEEVLAHLENPDNSVYPWVNELEVEFSMNQAKMMLAQ